MKNNYKYQKTVLILGVKKFNSTFLVLNFDKFLLFDSFFHDLANFWYLSNF